MKKLYYDLLTKFLRRISQGKFLICKKCDDCVTKVFCYYKINIELKY